MITYDDLVYYLREFAARYTDMDEFEADIALDEFLEDQEVYGLTKDDGPGGDE